MTYAIAEKTGAPPEMECIADSHTSLRGKVFQQKPVALGQKPGSVHGPKESHTDYLNPHGPGKQ